MYEVYMREKRMLWVLAALLTASGAVIPSASLAQPVGDGIGADAVRTMLDGYCVTCHNEGVVQGEDAAASPLVAQLRLTGLAFDSMDVSDVVWV